MKKQILLVIALFAVMTVSAVAQIPTTFNLQGYVTDNNGAPVDGDITVVLNFYTAETGGTSIYITQPQTITAVQGYFNFVTESLPRTLIVDLTKNPLWYEFTINGSLQGQRTRYDAVPYAIGAEFAKAADEAKPIGPAGGDFQGNYPNPRLSEQIKSDIADEVAKNPNLQAKPIGPAGGDIGGFYPNQLLINDRKVKGRHIDYLAITAENLDTGAVTLSKLAKPTGGLPQSSNYFTWWNGATQKWETAKLPEVLEELNRSLRDGYVPIWNATLNTFEDSRLYYDNIYDEMVMEGNFTVLDGDISLLGVGTAYFEGDLSVLGTTYLGDNLNVDADATVWGDATVYGNLEVQGETYLKDSVDVVGNVRIHGEAHADQLNISGTTIIGGSLVVGDATTLSSIEITGYDPATLTNTWSSIAGDSLIIDAPTKIIGGNNLTVTGQLIISGGTVNNGTTINNGNFQINGILGVTGATTLGNTLGVTGLSTLTGGFTTPANGVIGGTLAVTGASALTGNTTVGGTLDVTGATTLSSTLGVTGATTLGSKLNVTDTSIFTAMAKYADASAPSTNNFMPIPHDTFSFVTKGYVHSVLGSASVGFDSLESNGVDSFAVTTVKWNSTLTPPAYELFPSNILSKEKGEWFNLSDYQSLFTSIISGAGSTTNGDENLANTIIKGSVLFAPRNETDNGRAQIYMPNHYLRLGGLTTNTISPGWINIFPKPGQNAIVIAPDAYNTDLSGTRGFYVDMSYDNQAGYTNYNGTAGLFINNSSSDLSATLVVMNMASYGSWTYEQSNNPGPALFVAGNAELSGAIISKPDLDGFVYLDAGVKEGAIFTVDNTYSSVIEDGYDGQIIWIVNTGAASLTINSGNLPGGSINIDANTATNLIYIDATSMWYPVK